MLGKIEGRRRRGERMRWLNGITDAVDTNLGKLWEMVKDRKMKIMASGPITSWEVDGEAVETVSNFVFWGSKITAE